MGSLSTADTIATVWCFLVVGFFVGLRIWLWLAKVPDDKDEHGPFE